MEHAVAAPAPCLQAAAAQAGGCLGAAAAGAGGAAPRPAQPVGRGASASPAAGRAGVGRQTVLGQLVAAHMAQLQVRELYHVAGALVVFQLPLHSGSLHE